MFFQQIIGSKILFNIHFVALADFDAFISKVQEAEGMRRPLVRTSSQENNLFDPRKKSEISFLLFHLFIIFLTADIGMRRSKSSLTASCKNQKLDNCFQFHSLIFHKTLNSALANRPLRKIAMANSHKTAGQRSQFFFDDFLYFNLLI